MSFPCFPSFFPLSGKPVDRRSIFSFATIRNPLFSLMRPRKSDGFLVQGAIGAMPVLEKTTGFRCNGFSKRRRVLGAMDVGVLFSKRRRVLGAMPRGVSGLIFGAPRRMWSGHCR